MDFEEQFGQRQSAPTQDFIATVKVFPLIPYLKKDVIVSHRLLSSACFSRQLTASDVNFAVVRPLVLKYAKLRNMAAIYACMVVRSYFLSQAATDLAHSSIMSSRATLCEIMALKLLSHFASSKVQLVAVLTTLWNPLAGAPIDVVEEVKEAIGQEDCVDSSQSAIEMAIATKAKSFLASTIVQSVVNDMYTGRIAFTITANRSMVADNYKQRAIELYDVRRAPFLDHYRLRVPRYSAILHFMNIAVLLVTFVICLWTQDTTYISTWESVFLVFATAFTLQEYTATKEHGWLKQVWNAFDTSFVLVFLAYVGLRVKGLVLDEADTSKLAFDILACGGCILVPRLAFYAIANNVVVLALRAMISEFVFFICIAATCFSGLLLTLYTLASDTWTARGIAWLMVQIWFGNTYLSFGQATSFHPVLGPILMTCFAALSNTLLLTILISILSNTAARIDARLLLMASKYLFQHTIATIEGVKSDALFSYQPPFNVLAFFILKPASYLLSPRALHSANVFLIKLTSFPILIAIAIYERQLASGQKMRESGRDAAQSFYQSLPRQIKTMPLVEYLVGSKVTDLYDVIFEVEDSRDFNLFHESDHEDEGLLSPVVTSVFPASPMSQSPSRRLATLSDGQQTSPSPRRRKVSTLTPLEEISSNAKVLSLDTTTPLTRLFSRPKSAIPTANVDNLASVSNDTEGNLQRLQVLLEECRELPVRRLKDEMKELQDRQARIENLLLTLTRGMRNETERSRHATMT
ncbi:hypothetical protein HYDPIDRAFT_85148 [Hydnomerulius pinastri MD-312]|nr:hypothetical protein HYDPIDRAFT_85148 [Hydnomerulius pinastri MD-312]